MPLETLLPVCPLLAHGGAMAGAVAAAHMAGKPYKPVTRNRIPACTYCEPQIGSVGLTEQMARDMAADKGWTIKVGKFPLAGNSKATILNCARRVCEGDRG